MKPQHVVMICFIGWLLAPAPASPATIEATTTVQIGWEGRYPTCWVTSTEAASGSGSVSIGSGLDFSSCDVPPDFSWPSINITGEVDANTGYANIGVCGFDSSLLCDVNIRVDGGYLFEGHGIASFDFGSFYSAGYYSYGSLTFDGTVYDIPFGPYPEGSSLRLENVVLEMTHHITLQVYAGSDVAIGWSLGPFDGIATPGEAVPEPGILALIGLPLVILLYGDHRRRRTDE